MENFGYSYKRTKSLSAYQFQDIFEENKYFESKKFEKKKIFSLVNEIFYILQTNPSIQIFSYENKTFLKNFCSFLNECNEFLDINFDFFVYENKIFIFKSIGGITNFLFPDFSPKTKTLTFLKKIHLAYEQFLKTGQKPQKIIFSSSYEDFCDERKIFLFYFPAYKKNLYDNIFTKNLELDLYYGQNT